MKNKLLLIFEEKNQRAAIFLDMSLVYCVFPMTLIKVLCPFTQTFLFCLHLNSCGSFVLNMYFNL